MAARRGTRAMISGAKRQFFSWLRRRWRQEVYRNWYLYSPRWQAVRAVAALLDGSSRECPGEGCTYVGGLQGHHTTYRNKGHGLNLWPPSILREAGDIKRICWRCHNKEHRKK